jgi:membrane dipeptidase
MAANRREFIAGMTTMAASAGAARAAASSARATTPSAYDRAIVIDGLGGIDDPDGKDGDFVLTPRGLAQIRQSGVTAWQVTVGEVGNEPANWDMTINNIGSYGSVADANPGALVLARTAADIRAAKVAGKAALVFGTQDTAMVGTQLDRIGLLRGLGVRVVQLTYNLRNLSGDGALEPANSGLSKLGRATIERIESEKLLLDLSHGGQRTIAEAIAAAKRPMTISHTGCRSLHDNPRNVWDAELKAMADKGGVVGIYWMPFLVPGSKPVAADLVRHMRHAVDVCGEDHVSIGTDGMLSKTIIDDKSRANQAKFFKDRTARGISAPGEGPDIFNIIPDLDSHLRFRMLAEALARDGWPWSRIEKILGGNILRLYAEAWGG